MRVEFGKPLIGRDDRDMVVAALAQRTLTNGPRVTEFEAAFSEYTQGGMATAVTSCMAALHIACLMLVKPGDEVIVPALTHPATALAVSLVGADPIFVDVDPATGNIDPEEIKKALTRRTAAIMPVHYLGRLCDMARINQIAREHSLSVIEDCALALGARHRSRHAGLWGDVGTFSFYPVKHMTTGEGGMLLTKHPGLAERAKRLRAFGKDEAGNFVDIGMNYRMSEMQAALGLAQLKKQSLWLDRRESNHAILRHHLRDFGRIESMPGAAYAMSVFAPEGMSRDTIRDTMHARWVETSVYYNPIPPLTPYYMDLGYAAGDFPIAEKISRETICLSCGPHLSRQQLAFQIEQFKIACDVAEPVRQAT